MNGPDCYPKTIHKRGFLVSAYVPEFSPPWWPSPHDRTGHNDSDARIRDRRIFFCGLAAAMSRISTDQMPVS
jgi:hypothetical protein